MDTDGDGRISADEWSKAKKRFRQIDANRDGYVTAQEIAAFRRGGAAPAVTKKPATKRVARTSSGYSSKSIKWIDVHFHLVADAGDINGFTNAAEKALGIMNDNNMSRIIAMSPPRPKKNFDIESIGHLGNQFSDHIAIIGGGGTLNPMIQAYGHEKAVPQQVRNEFTRIADSIIAAGAKGFGEITAHHVSLSPTHGYEWVPADNPLLLLLADIAARHNVPIDFHFDPVPKNRKKPGHLTSPKNPAILKENLSSFERLLKHNRNTKIVWAHAGSDPVGWFTPKLARKMLEKHPNLFFSVRPMGPPENSPAWHPRDGANSSWTRLFRKYPDRFVIGTDTFIVSDTYSGTPHAPLVLQQRTAKQRGAVNDLLSSLKNDVARKIAYENAIRIYRLNES